MFRDHPDRSALLEWLHTGEPKRVDRHIADCEHCQSALDELSKIGDDLKGDLTAALDPGEDLSVRTTDGVRSRLRDEAALGAFLDLFTIGWDVVRTMTDGASTHDSVAPADENHEGEKR